MSAYASLAATRESLCVQIGPRRVEPYKDIITELNTQPTNDDKIVDASLKAYMDVHVPMESLSELRKRETILSSLKAIFTSWVQEVCIKKGKTEEFARSAGGLLYTSGSYRLAIHEPGSDIDTICVAPNICDREDFFDSLAEKIKNHPEVTNFVSIASSFVPILTFYFSGVDIDLLFAKVNYNQIPPDFDIDCDDVMVGIDTATEKSLNGPRTTNLIARLVNGTEERYQRFLTVVRCVRKWAKAKGLYSNKMGYLGGVNINIMVAHVVQRLPDASTSRLLRMFFSIYKIWYLREKEDGSHILKARPDPIMLTGTYHSQLPGCDYQVWDPEKALPTEMMPIITPAYPSMNSTFSINKKTQEVMVKEILKADQLLSKMDKSGSLKSKKNRDGHLWAELFTPSDFFISYAHYLALVVVSPTADELEGWHKFLEAKLRNLVVDTGKR